MNDAQLQRSVVRGKRVFLVFLASMLLIPFGFLMWMPDAWGNIRVVASIFFALAITCAVAIREKRIDQRAAGVIPAKPGFSGQVDVLATKLRERATAIENAATFGRPIDSIDPEIEATWNSVKATARDHDTRAPSRLRAVAPGEAIDFNDADAVRSVAAMLESYASDLRSRPSVYHVTAREFRNTVIGFVMIAAAGAFMAFRYEGTVQGCGVMMIISAVLMIIIGVFAQRSPS